jgi:hypothetical protein
MADEDTLQAKDSSFPLESAMADDNEPVEMKLSTIEKIQF